jgi:hypothetical protein
VICTPTSQRQPIATSGSVSMTNQGGYYRYSFTSTGSITF